MSYFDKKDDTRTVLNHLGDKVPDSVRQDARRELMSRGYSSEQVRDEEWKRMK